MKDISIKLTRNIKMLWMLCVMALILVPLILEQTSLAQKEPDVVVQPFKINGKEAKEYLIEKYKISGHDLTSELKQTVNGPSGKLHLRGNIMQKNVVITEDTVQGRARTIAKAFLEEEASLFGITNIDEIRETKINTTKGYKGDVTSVHYRRYINNMELENVHIRITVGPDETITGASAYLVPPPHELYDAVTKETLTETAIRRIIEQDLKAPGIDSKAIKVARTKKIATPSPPYVIWKVSAYVKNIGSSSWNYRIDAFTGEILEKGSAIKYLR